MTAYTILVEVLLFLTVANGWQNEEDSDVREYVKFLNHRAKDPVTRHRSRRWHTRHGYDYQRSANLKRDPYRHEMGIHPEVLKRLDEILMHVKRPLLPPKVIYVRYPVPYRIPQYCKCNKNEFNITGIEERWSPSFEDSNQNWGFEDTLDEEVDEDYGDEARPISFDTIVPKRPSTRPIVEVDHGTNEIADNRRPNGKFLTPCDAAALSCCKPSNTQREQKRCFINAGCTHTYGDGKVCKIENLTNIIEMFSNAYAPV